jgi:hypothetical protein
MDERPRGDERREIDSNPVGQRPQDLRARTDVIKERDAKHLSDVEPGVTTSIEDADRAGERDMPVGAGGPNPESRRIRAQTPDGKPYADAMDPDSQFDGTSNTGQGSLP